MTLRSTSLLRLGALATMALAAVSGTGCSQILEHARQASEGPVPVAVQMTMDESMLFSATNNYRKANGLPELQPDARLVNVARMRSKDMAARQYFSHVTPDGEDVFSLMHEEHVNFQAAGENLAETNLGADKAATQTIRSWEGSVEHRLNMLHPAFTHMGVGMAIAKGGKRYFTQVFTD